MDNRRNGPNKTTLVIDGNWFLMSRLYALIDSFSISEDKKFLKESQMDLESLMAQSINKIINFFGDNIDNIMMVHDDGSWRKHIDKPKLYKEEYKGNRIKEEKYSWNHIWGALNNFCSSLTKNHITCVSEKGVEGDDWCWFWSRYLNSIGTNVILWTSDRDIMQLIQKDERTNAWTVWFNEKKGLVVNNVYEEKDDFLEDLISIERESDSGLNKLIDEMRRMGVDVSYVNPLDIITSKVICGDDGDNIKALIRVEKNKRIQKVSEKEWDSINEGYENMETFVMDRTNIINKLKRLKRFVNNNDSIEDLEDMFDFNVKLVWLDRLVIPEEIKRKMTSYTQEYVVTDLDYIRNNYKVLLKDDGVDLENLFRDIE